MPVFTFAVLSDIHDALTTDDPDKRGDWGDVLLQRAVYRLNRVIRPDAVVVLGDLVDDPAAPDVTERLERLRDILGELEAPSIVLPGNHDPEAQQFYKIFTAPEPVVDIGPVRFLPFIDPFTPDYNAERPQAHIERFATARNGHGGPIVALQHVPVLPPGQTESRFNYVNAEAILAAMDEHRITLSVSGHEHRGTASVRHGDTTCFVAPALCKAPFPVTVVRITEQGEIQVDTEPLQMPRELGLIDYHSHTEFAYCGQDVALQDSSELADLFGLGAMAFTEHTGQLYFDNPTFFSGSFCVNGMAGARASDFRIQEYWERTASMRRPNRLIGFEVDADFNGNPVIAPEERERADVLIGAIHFLPETIREKGENEAYDLDRIIAEFMHVMERFVPSDVDIVAHPFRIFQWAGFEAPEHLYDPVVRLLKEHNVAAEINFHKNRPEAEFFRRCLAAGVKLTFGGDAHQRFQVGEFAQHLRFVRDELGYDGDLHDILAKPDRRS